MREIKFRAWNKDRKEWAYLFIVNGSANIFCHQEGTHEDWQQYTGLKDKNGKDIYEGDIVENTETGTSGEVIYAEIYAMFVIKTKKNSEDGISRFQANGTKAKLRNSLVIGNIYENPELIK